MEHPESPFIDRMLPEDWPEVSRIYLEGIATDQATFQTEGVPWDAWDAAHHDACRLVVRDGTRLAGWAALSPVSQRRVYRGVAEVSVYVAEYARGRGLGRQLMNALVSCSERNGIWTLQASIFRENEASLALHERCGFRVVGVRERIGQHHGQWRDTLLLERRSALL